MEIPKRQRVLRMLALAAALSFGLLVTFSQPGLAQSMTLSPQSGEVGSVLTVSGGGFTPSVTFRTHFAYDTSYELVRSGVVAEDGTIYDSFEVPVVPAGEYVILVETSETNSSSDTFSVIPEVKLDKKSVYVGDEVTIGGTGFSVTMPIKVSINNTILARTATELNGSFGEITFEVPEAPNGTCTLTVDDVIYEVSAELKILHSMTVTPNSGAIGETINIGGTGFEANKPIALTYGGAEVTTTPKSVATNSKGSFNASFTVPERSSPSYEIRVSDGVNSASAIFDVLAGIILLPKDGLVDDEITVSGSTFEPYRSISICFDGTEIATIKSSQNGIFKTSFRIPESSSGVHKITASDTVNSMDASLTVLPGVTLTPKEGPEGTGVTLNGTGFKAQKLLTITFDDDAVGIITTSSKGSFSYTFEVPQCGTGDHELTASDGKNKVSSPFTVNLGITLSQTSGSVGTKLTLSGSKFFGVVTVKYDDLEVARTYTEEDGAFSVSFDVPPSAPGEHLITVTDRIRELQTTFNVESVSVQSPTLLSPENEAIESPHVSFRWQPADSPSAASYTLQIASDEGFNDIVFEVSEIKGSKYTLAEGEELEPTPEEAPYYWRLKARDLSSNESAWSAPRSFYARSSSNWFIYALIGLGALLAGALAFWLTKRFMAR